MTKGPQVWSLNFDREPEEGPTFQLQDVDRSQLEGRWRVQLHSHHEACYKKAQLWLVFGAAAAFLVIFCRSAAGREVRIDSHGFRCLDGMQFLFGFSPSASLGSRQGHLSRRNRSLFRAEAPMGAT